MEKERLFATQYKNMPLVSALLSFPHFPCGFASYFLELYKSWLKGLMGLSPSEPKDKKICSIEHKSTTQWLKKWIKQIGINTNDKLISSPKQTILLMIVNIVINTNQMNKNSLKGLS